MKNEICLSAKFLHMPAAMGWINLANVESTPQWACNVATRVILSGILSCRCIVSTVARNKALKKLMTLSIVSYIRWQSSRNIGDIENRKHQKPSGLLL